MEDFQLGVEPTRVWEPQSTRLSDFLQQCPEPRCRHEGVDSCTDWDR